MKASICVSFLALGLTSEAWFYWEIRLFSSPALLLPPISFSPVMGKALRWKVSSKKDDAGVPFS